jgi:hypothetical protein
MTTTTYTIIDECGCIERTTDTELASRLSRAGLHVTAVTGATIDVDPSEVSANV